MPRHRDFEAARAEARGEPITFTLDGAGPFRVVETIPAGLLFDLVEALPDEDAAPERAVDAFRAFSAFLVAVVVEEHRAAFRAAIAETTFETLSDLAAWVMEEVSGRPLSPASSSESSPSRSGLSSRSVSLAPVEPKVRSA